MRLINADTLIDKSYWHGELPTYDNPFPHGRDAVDIEDIENTPTIDAIEVVRCKDCKNRGTESCYLYFYDAGYNEFGEDYVHVEDKTKDDFFCANGEQNEVQE